jgi:hypothetical protein
LDILVEKKIMVNIEIFDFALLIIPYRSLHALIKSSPASRLYLVRKLLLSISGQF